MFHLIAAARSWPLLVRIVIATIAVAAATALQLPVDVEIPGEPFLLHFIVVALTSVFLGRAAGFFTAGATTVASVMYFEPVFMFKVARAVDLFTVEAYGIAAAASVEGLCRLVESGLAERSEADSQRFRRHEAETRLTAIELMARNLAESEARFRATFENAAVGIGHLSPDLRWLRANETLCRIVGWPIDELINKSPRDISHPDDLADELSAFEQLRAGKISSFSLEKRSVRKDGTIVWIRRTASCVRKPDGSIDYFVTVVEDISDRKLAEEKIRLLMREGQPSRQEHPRPCTGNRAADDDGAAGAIRGALHRPSPDACGQSGSAGQQQGTRG